jgi:hypothetical protein
MLFITRILKNKIYRHETEHIVKWKIFFAKRKKHDSSLEKFFVDQLKDIYYAEQKLVKAYRR